MLGRLTGGGNRGSGTDRASRLGEIQVDREERLPALAVEWFPMFSAIKPVPSDPRGSSNTIF